jgi:hypothetical protein
LPYFFGDGNHEAEVGFDEFVFGLLRVHLALDDFALRAVQLLEAHAGVAFQAFQVGEMLPLRLAVIFLEFFAAPRYPRLDLDAIPVDPFFSGAA